MRLGLGSGSTARAFVAALGRRIADGLTILPAVATSTATEAAARDAGVPLCDGADVITLDMAVDGTDEVDPAFRLIKGGGGCLLREKIVAQMAARFVVIADATKRVPTLGAFPLPVEVVAFAEAATASQLASLGCEPQRRMDGAVPFVTDNGNHIYDCAFGAITAPEELARRLDALPGAMAHGLFLSEANDLVLGADGAAQWVTIAR